MKNNTILIEKIIFDPKMSKMCQKKILYTSREQGQKKIEKCVKKKYLHFWGKIQKNDFY